MPARSAVIRWLTSTPTAACPRSSGSCSTPACSTVTASPVPGRRWPGRSPGPPPRIPALCRQRGIPIALMTDARFSGGSVGLVIGHVSPEAALGGPIALIEDGDTIVVDVNDDTLDCAELDDAATLAARQARWQGEAERNGGTHPLVRVADTRLLPRMGPPPAPPPRGAGLSEA